MSTTQGIQQKVTNSRGKYNLFIGTEAGYIWRGIGKLTLSASLNFLGNTTYWIARVPHMGTKLTVTGNTIKCVAL